MQGENRHTPPPPPPPPPPPTLAAIADDINRALEEYRFNDAASSIYQFVWHEFCDWYLEMAKPEIKPPTPPSPARRMAGGPSRGAGEGGGEISELRTPSSEAGVRWCLLHTLDTSLRLLHPFMPFVTEEIWQKIPHVKSHLPETEKVRSPTHPSPSRGEGEGGGEISELRTPSSEAGVRWCLLHTLDTSLRLLHPFMPFVTEEIWQTIP
ncbi:MAG: class I tRNA ligase family protein, partial [Pseudomonadota bacterium]